MAASMLIGKVELGLITHGVQDLAGAMAGDERDVARGLRAQYRVFDRTVGTRSVLGTERRSLCIKLIIGEASTTGRAGGVKAIAAFAASAAVGSQIVIDQASSDNTWCARCRAAQSSQSQRETHGRVGPE